MQLSDAKGSFLFASSDALLNDPFASTIFAILVAQLELRYEIYRGFGIGHNDAAVWRMPREQDGADIGQDGL